MLWLWSRRGRITLGAVGLALAVAPIVGAQVLIDHSTRDRARGIVTALAQDFVANSERTFDRGLAALNTLSLGGIRACGPTDVALMRRVVTSLLAVKMAAVVDGAGNPICNQFGTADAVVPLAPPQPLGDGHTSVQPVRLQSTGSRVVMFARNLDSGTRAAVFVADNSFARGNLPRVLKGTAVGLLTLANGMMIGSFGAEDQVASGDVVAANVSSDRLPIAMHLSAPYRVFQAQSAELLLLARLGGGLASTLIFVLLVYLLRGPPVEIARLREAEANGEFVPYYQPVIDIDTGRLVGCEVLMRWVKPNGTVVEPDSFIQLAESSGLAVPMTRSLMHRVRDDLDHAFGARPQLNISINLFNDHFVRLKTVHDIEGIFRGAGVSFNQLVFELTERQPLRDVRRARVIIRELQALGARVALDDAGAGHGGLAYLHHLGVDVVKIDRLFIETIAVGRTASPIVDSLIKLGHDLNMKVVAEGVETFEQLDYLRRHGADGAQGFLFSPPMPARAFLDLVETMEPLGRDLPARPEGTPAPRLAEPAAVSAA